MTINEKRGSRKTYFRVGKKTITMKKAKFLLSIFSVLAGIMTFSSCKKSYKCCATYQGVEECQTIQRNQFDSDKEFKDEIKYLEDEGYTCS